MGSSATSHLLSEELLHEYTALTYLSPGEVCHLLKKVHSIAGGQLERNLAHRFSRREIVAKFDVLKNNPFLDRLFRVFSSARDDCLSFEDLLDLCSAMSAACPADVKAAWAFRLFDMDEDNQISGGDIALMLERLTRDPNDRRRGLDGAAKAKIAEIILEEMKLDFTGGIGISEFTCIVARIPEFSSSFYFRL